MNFIDICKITFVEYAYFNLYIYIHFANYTYIIMNVKENIFCSFLVYFKFKWSRLSIRLSRTDFTNINEKKKGLVYNR